MKNKWIGFLLVGFILFDLVFFLPGCAVKSERIHAEDGEVKTELRTISVIDIGDTAGIEQEETILVRDLAKDFEKYFGKYICIRGNRIFVVEVSATSEEDPGPEIKFFYVRVYDERNNYIPVLIDKSIEEEVKPLEPRPIIEAISRIRVERGNERLPLILKLVGLLVKVEKRGP
jgi:hypothetical protein